MLTALSRRDIAAWIGFVILGAVGGAALAVILLGQEVDQLTLDNVHLMDQIERLSHRLDLLDSRGPSSGAYVEAIEITAQGVERARPAIEQALKGLLTHLVGEELDSINAGTIHKALERNIMLDRQEYLIQVKYVYVTPTLRAHVEVRSGGEPDLIE